MRNHVKYFLSVAAVKIGKKNCSQSFVYICLQIKDTLVKYENLLLRTHVSLIHSQFPLQQKGPLPCGQLAQVSAVCLPQLTILPFD